MSEKVELNEDELFVLALGDLCMLLAEGKPYISKEIAECFTAPKLGLQYGPKETMQRYAKRLLMQAAHDYKLRHRNWGSSTGLKKPCKGTPSDCSCKQRMITNYERNWVE